MTSRWLVWDFDGTLAHRPGMWSGAVCEVLERALPTGAAISREQVAPWLQSGFPWHTPDVAHTRCGSPERWWATLAPVLVRALYQSARPGPASPPGGSAALPHNEVDHAMSADSTLSWQYAERLWPAVRAAYLRPDAWQVYPDTVEALRALSGEGWHHAVLSNHVPELPALMQSLGLWPFFEVVVHSAAIGWEKPNVAAFDALRRRLPSTVERLVMIGDSRRADVDGARRAGWEAILVRQPPGVAEPLTAPDLRHLSTVLGERGDWAAGGDPGATPAGRP